MIIEQIKLNQKQSYTHDYYEIVDLMLTISNSTILTQNFVTMFNPQHNSTNEFISSNEVIVQDTIFCKDKKVKLDLDQYVYYLSFICNWNKIDYVMQMHKFYSEYVNNFCYAFTTVFFDYTNKIANVETTNICTAIETLGTELFEEDAYYYNWFTDSLIKGTDLYNIGMIRKEKIIWH